jgi:hypothetical protein
MFKKYLYKISSTSPASPSGEKKLNMMVANKVAPKHLGDKYFISRPGNGYSDADLSCFSPGIVPQSRSRPLSPSSFSIHYSLYDLR